MQRKAVAIEAVREAAAFLRRSFGAVRKGTPKADGSLVSVADHGSDERIVKALRRAFPDDGILSEERAEISGTSGYRWLLDPLDGTHNFLAGLPLFGIVLALEKEGSPVLSVLMFPLLDELFVAEAGKGARKNGKRIHVSQIAALKETMVLVDGSTKVVAGAVARDAKALLAGDNRFRFLGNGAFSLTRVATGSVPAAVLQTGKPWDIVAPSLLVTEAGGRVTAFSTPGVPEQGLLASNGLVHDEVLSRLGRRS